MDTLVFWHWLAFGLLLLVAEVVLPGVVILWFSVGAMVVGLIMLVAPGISFEFQVLIFAVVSLGSLILGRRFVAKRLHPDDHPQLSRRGDQMMGRQFTLGANTADGRTRQKIGDTTWSVAVEPNGHDLRKGDKAEIVAVRGATLIIAGRKDTADAAQAKS